MKLQTLNSQFKSECSCLYIYIYTKNKVIIKCVFYKNLFQVNLVIVFSCQLYNYSLLKFTIVVI
jgi:hypothetical protein